MVSLFLSTGHNEDFDIHDIGSTGFSEFRRFLERLNFDVSLLSTSVENNLANQQSLLAIVDPRGSFLDIEKERILNFVRGGGSLLIIGSGRSKTEEQTVNKIVSPLLGIKLNSDEVSDPTKISQYRGQIACPYPDVIEAVIEKEAENFNHFTGVKEISYAYGCSLFTENDSENISVISKSNDNCAPSNTPLIALGSIGHGKVAVIGSKDMFSNDVSFGLYVSHNSILLEGIINWLSIEIAKPFANLVESSESETYILTDNKNNVESDDQLRLVLTEGDDLVFKKIEDSFLNDAIVHQEIEKLVECLTQMSLLRIAIRDDEAVIAEKGVVELNTELISQKRKDILRYGDNLQSKTNEQKDIVNRIMRRLRGVYDISDLDLLSKKLISTNQSFPQLRDAFDDSNMRANLPVTIDLSGIQEPGKSEKDKYENKNKLKESKELSPHIQEIISKFQREITDLEIVIKTERDVLRDLEMNPATATSEKEKYKIKLRRHENELDKMIVQADALIKIIKTSD